MQGSCQVMKELKGVKAMSARSKHMVDEKTLRTCMVKLPQLGTGKISKQSNLSVKVSR